MGDGLFFFIWLCWFWLTYVGIEWLASNGNDFLLSASEVQMPKKFCEACRCLSKLFEVIHNRSNPIILNGDSFEVKLSRGAITICRMHAYDIWWWHGVITFIHSYHPLTIGELVDVGRSSPSYHNKNRTIHEDWKADEMTCEDLKWMKMNASIFKSVFSLAFGPNSIKLFVLNVQIIITPNLKFDLIFDCLESICKSIRQSFQSLRSCKKRQNMLYSHVSPLLCEWERRDFAGQIDLWRKERKKTHTHT